MFRQSVNDLTLEGNAPYFHRFVYDVVSKVKEKYPELRTPNTRVEPTYFQFEISEKEIKYGLHHVLEIPDALELAYNQEKIHLSHLIVSETEEKNSSNQNLVNLLYNINKSYHEVLHETGFEIEKSSRIWHPENECFCYEIVHLSSVSFEEEKALIKLLIQLLPILQANWSLRYFM